eukprot:2645655-Amphidinium_carterae.1
MSADSHVVAALHEVFITLTLLSSLTNGAHKRWKSKPIRSGESKWKCRFLRCCGLMPKASIAGRVLVVGSVPDLSQAVISAQSST